MEESLNGSGRFVPRDNIRSVQSYIKAQLDNYEVDISDTSFLETSNVCDSVRNRILNYEDEPHLTKTENNRRRIFIASELFISICSVYENIVDYEFSRIIFDMVQWEKYKRLSREITRKIQSESKAEKHFAVEARNKLKEAEIGNSEAEVVGQDAPQPEESSETETEFFSRYERETHPLGQQTAEAIENGTPSEINETLEHALSTIPDNLTTMRDETYADASGQQFPFSNVTRLDLPVPEAVVESSIQEPEAQENLDENLREILEILEDKDPQTEMGPIEQPDTSLESAEELPPHQAVQAVEERPSPNGNQADASEESEKWSLPSLESAKTTRKRRRHLIIDEETTIHHYSERAMRLNRNINPQRVQVFEGPPEILQAFSAGHLLRTPAFNTSFFRDVRSSTLSTLYNRHLRTETRSVETILSERRAVDERRGDISKTRTNLEITEDVGVRTGMHSAAEKSDVLAEVVPKRSRLEDLAEIAPPAVPPNEIGMPISRVINSTLPPLDHAQMERINNVPVSPRVQQCQGQTIDPKTSPPWFLSTRENSPSAKYREFDYVYKNIQKYWLAFEEERMEKCVTLREFLSLESAESVANFLTVLRIVDKMSIQRKLRLEYKDGDVFIRPFESLYISDGELILPTP